MLRCLPSDRLHIPSKRTPVRSTFHDAKVEPQTVGIGILTLLMVGLTAMTIGTIAQPTTISSNPQRTEDCQPHEVFRVSDRQCYQGQGE